MIGTRRLSQAKCIFPQGVLISKKLDRAFPGDTAQVFGKQIDWVAFEASHACDPLFCKAYKRPRRYTLSEACAWLASLPDSQAKEVINNSMMTPGQRVGLAYFYATRRDFYIHKRRRELLQD